MTSPLGYSWPLGSAIGTAFGMQLINGGAFDSPLISPPNLSLLMCLQLAQSADSVRLFLSSLPQLPSLYGNAARHARCNLYDARREEVSRRDRDSFKAYSAHGSQPAVSRGVVELRSAFIQAQGYLV